MNEPCPVYGHHDQRATTCRACRAEWLETRRWPDGSVHREATPVPTPQNGSQPHPTPDTEDR